MPVLYRKYRPQTFSEVVGQKAIIKTLQNQVQAGQISHAYLFIGSRGVGKTSVARILAKAVNCKNRGQGTGDRAKSDACGECEVCKAVEQGNFLDLIEIDAASNTGVDNVRELIEHVRFAPSSGKYKVFIVDEVHMLSKGAFNALLKTLEEPPAHAIFVLATTEVAKVPATIISRTQRFDFKKLSLEETEAHLKHIITEEKMELSKEAIKLIALHSDGGLRDALSLLDKVFTLGNSPSLDEVLYLIGITDAGLLEKFLGLIVSRSPSNIPELLDELLEKGADFVVFNRDFLEYLRKILIVKITGQENKALFSGERQNKAKEFAIALSENEIISIIRLFLRSLKEQATAPSTDLPVLLAGVEAAMRRNNNDNNNNNISGLQPVANSQSAVWTSSAGALARPATPSPKIEVADSSVSVNPVRDDGGIRPRTTSLRGRPPSSQNNLFISPPTSSAAFSTGVKKESIAVQDAPAPLVDDPPPIISATKEEIASKWPEVLEKLKNVNGPLANFLKSSLLDRINGNRIIVSVKYKFHKQNLEHQKNQEAIGKILKEVYGVNLAIGGEVAVHQEADKAPAGGLADALKVFGGELIE